MLSPMSRTQRARKRPQSLAEAIRQEREDRQWSQSKLARMLDTPEKNVKNWEGGTLPSFPLYARMCLLFGWPLPYSSNRPNPGYADPDASVISDEPLVVAVR
jgi:transcriptional regulator with XRE-family HTH domain